MFASLLIANRGEIAVRIVRTARRMGIRTIAVYSEADQGALHTRVADEAVLIGPADARRSYLDVERILEAARERGAEAIHPGYGFLAENAPFAEACAAAGITFVGPPPEAIRVMGSKAEAKALMIRAGVQVVPGYHGEMQDTAFLKRKAYEIGYPILVKAVAGGGGKGMRRVDKALDFEDALDAARREAMAAFGDDRVLLERCLERPRHVEIQVFADTHGNTVSLHERDCSLQRRHQKVMEEAPAPGMSEAVRAAMGEAAVRAAQAVGYVGAGTVEFVASASEPLSPTAFFFLEMNTRLQVEHPVTEMVTGTDLVAWQLRVAAGEPLAASSVPPPSGHAVEARIYAEDPDNGFLPSAGRLAVVRWPEGVRVDAGVAEGDEVVPHYDPMIAKIIVHAPDRAAALAAMAEAVEAAIVVGPKTNLPFLRALLEEDEVRAGTHDTGLIARAASRLVGGSVSTQAIADAASTLLSRASGEPTTGFRDPWTIDDGFRVSGHARRTVRLLVDGTPADALVDDADGSVRIDGAVGRGPSERVLLRDGVAYAVEGGRAVSVALVDQTDRRAEAELPGGEAIAPMHGRVVALFVAPGDEVTAGARLFAVEAMKMEHTVKAPRSARVVAVRRDVGDQVGEGEEVIRLSPPPD